MILSGQVRVNGAVVTKLGTKVDPSSDKVEVAGQPVRLKQQLVYIALNKPKGYVASCHQPGAKIVLDLVDIPVRVYPVGRLDKDSSGLLLLTNDGRLHQLLAHPRFDHEKEYIVRVARPVSGRSLQRMAAGMPLLGTRTRPARVHRLAPNSFRIVLREGKNRQIRRMVRKFGNHVVALKRIRTAHIRLGGLSEGAWRHLSQQELKPFLDMLQDEENPICEP